MNNKGFDSFVKNLVHEKAPKVEKKKDAPSIVEKKATKSETPQSDADLLRMLAGGQPAQPEVRPKADAILGMTAPTTLMINRALKRPKHAETTQ